MVRVAENAHHLRIAVVSMHTSPLDSPGAGDAGGMNVYVAQTTAQLPNQGCSVDVFFRAREAAELRSVVVGPGVTVHGLQAGPLSPVAKGDLPGLVSPFTSELLRHEAEMAPAPFDVVHSHYWLSGQAGAIAADRWGAPLVHTMHTMGGVKNSALAESDVPEPQMRILAERDLAGRSEGLIASTFDEASDLIQAGADPGSLHVVWPGVDLNTFSPGSAQLARKQLGLREDALILLFVGRIQPLKAPDHLIRVAAELIRANPSLRERLSVVVCGGLSGAGERRPDSLVQLASELGVENSLRLVPPTDSRTLANWYRAADMTVMPSYSESFGLVALESQACGTPVVAADVGGLRTSVGDGNGGVLVAGRDLGEWTSAVLKLANDERRLQRMGVDAVSHAQNFDWERTARDTAAVYRRTLAAHRPLVPATGATATKGI
jgi:D-inositol-3-phosphate glycosyltransferase